MALEPSSSHSRSSTPLPRTAVSENVDGETHGSQRDSPERQVRSIKSKKLTSDNKGLQQRSQRPLPAEVARRAFECVVDTHGVMAQVLDPTKQAAAKRYGDHDGEAINIVGRGHPLRLAHGQPTTAPYRLEPLRFGAEFNLGDRQGTCEGAWGVDLHWCDLAALVGFPGEGESPWDSDDENVKDEGEDDLSSWRCVFLDVSLNHLKGIDAVADQPGLHGVAVLDISNNLIDDLDGVQNLPNLQILVASNNQLGSTEALGELPKDAGLHHVDLCHNAIFTLETPRFKSAFQNIKTLRLASNRLQSFEEDAAIAMTSLERLDVSDNELVSVDSVAFLPALVFLDCSENRLSILSTFASALAGPPRLAEVVAEGNKVTSDPQYRVTVLMKCKNVRRLDYRPVDGAALMRQYYGVLESKALADVRETANREYYRSVEQERARLDQRKTILKTQEKQLNDAFQEYRLQRQREMEECVALAASLRREGGGAGARGQLTPNVAHLFQGAVEQRGSKPEHKASGHDETGGDGENNLSAVLRGVVRQEKRSSKTSTTNNTSSEGGSSSNLYYSGSSRGDDGYPHSSSRYDSHSSVESRGSTSSGSNNSRGSSSGPEEHGEIGRERPRQDHPESSSEGKPKGRNVPPVVGSTRTASAESTAVEKAEGGSSRNSVVTEQETKPPRLKVADGGRVRRRGGRQDVDRRDERGSRVAADMEKKRSSLPSVEVALVPATKDGPTGLRRVFGAIGMRKERGKNTTAHGGNAPVSIASKSRASSTAGGKNHS